MFDGKRINSLEQSVGTLTEELTRTNETITTLNNTIEALFKNIEEIVGELNKTKSEKDELEKNYSAFKKAFEEIYKIRIDRTLEEMTEKSDKDKSDLREEIKKVSEIVDELKNNSDKADEKHNAQIEALTKSTDALVKKCEDIQLSNVQIMNQHNDMIKRYEQSIKEYAEQTERMKNNVLKKMNANNIISVIEE